MNAFLNQSVLIPAGITVLSGLFILNFPLAGERPPGEIAQRRFAVFLLIAGALLSLALVLASRLGNLNEQLRFIIPALFGLGPALMGVLALTLVNLRSLAGMERKGKALAIFSGLAILILIPAGRLNFWGTSTLQILMGVVSLSIIWSIHRKQKTIVVLTLATLALLALSNRGPDAFPLLGLPEWAYLPAAYILYALPGLVVGLAAVAVANGLLRSLAKGDGNAGAEGSRLTVIPALLWFALAAILLGSLAYAMLWASIWDQTRWDGIAALVLVGGASFIVPAAGMWLVFAVQGWRRLTGAAFAMLALLIIARFGATGHPSVTKHAVTEGRAARIERALESFHSRTGSYPKELGELVPRDILWVPRPVLVLYAENWCYLGGGASYRLAAIYREFTAEALSVRVYAAAGNPPDSDPACEQQLTEISERYETFLDKP